MSTTAASKGVRQLRVWQTAVELATEVCLLARELPREERYALGEQMRRAAVSIGSNIAEGYARPHQPGSTADYKRFIGMARGSHGELETQLEIVQRLGCTSTRITRIKSLLDACGRMLWKLHASL